MPCPSLLKSGKPFYPPSQLPVYYNVFESDICSKEYSVTSFRYDASAFPVCAQVQLGVLHVQHFGICVSCSSKEVAYVLGALLRTCQTLVA